ncbi:MAG: right-handed parallel beta-helix repeat-containing protein [Brevefilum sp.]|nr:right-handed parallel beta-helix repeat-containing protein [Brevefilum sp.]
MMKKLRLTLAILILFSIVQTPTNQVKAETRVQYRYVVPDGSTTSAYCSAQEPCDLGRAIDVVAQPGDTIIVHSGTYYPPLQAIDLLFINKSLTLWGSCEFDASTPFVCDPDARSSILDAQNANRVIRVGGTGGEEVHIEGFTIMGGTGVSMFPCYASYNGCGAGIHATDLESLTLKNNYIYDNQAGNTSGIGGGFFAKEINFLQVEHNSFRFNQATQTGLGWGGAAFVADSGGPNAVIFENNQFFGNEISEDDLPNNLGAGLVVTRSNNVQIHENAFEQQNAMNQNVNLIGTSLYLSEITGFSIKRNTFKDNWGSSDTSIGILSDGSISQNKWWNNMVFYNLELLGDVQADISNNFLGRQMLGGTVSRGGGSTNIYLKGDPSSPPKGIKIVFNTIAAADCGIEVGDNSSVDIAANIFTELTVPILLSQINVTATIDQNLFYSNIKSHSGNNPILEDPKLVDVANGDFHLLPGSGAIDRISGADFDEDIDGDTRPFGLSSTPYDVGADEFRYKIFLPLIVR